jgi:hypothetical protein
MDTVLTKTKIPNPDGNRTAVIFPAGSHCVGRDAPVETCEQKQNYSVIRHSNIVNLISHSKATSQPTDKKIIIRN